MIRAHLCLWAHDRTKVGIPGRLSANSADFLSDLCG